MLDCIVLVGGLGTRLHSIVPDRPKPLALINGIPFLAILIQTLLSSHLIHKVVFAVGYKAEMIIDFFAHANFPGLVEFSRENSPLGTGGAVKNALEKTTTEHILVVNGDSYLNFSLEDLWAQHSQADNDCTIVYTHVPDTSCFGRIEIDEKSKKVISFQEKTSFSGPGFINAGIYLFRREVLDTMSLSEKFSLEGDVFPQLVKQGVGAFFSPGTFIDIGTPDSYRNAQTVLASLTCSKGICL